MCKFVTHQPLTKFQGGNSWEERNMILVWNKAPENTEKSRMYWRGLAAMQTDTVHGENTLLLYYLV